MDAMTIYMQQMFGQPERETIVGHVTVTLNEADYTLLEKLAENPIYSWNEPEEGQPGYAETVAFHRSMNKLIACEYARNAPDYSDNPLVVDEYRITSQGRAALNPDEVF